MRWENLKRSRPKRVGRDLLNGTKRHVRLKLQHTNEAGDLNFDV